jgi:hypothetical protein
MLMDLSILKNEILSLPAKEPVFIFIGVGTFAGLLNSNGTLAPENYHQFPPFVQDLRNRIHNLNLFLVLIDPSQENPPYLTRDFPLIEVCQDHYKNQDSRLQVFVKRNVVYTETDNKENYDNNAINITETLRDLNNFAIEHHISLLYHDFTGRRTSNLAEYFEHDYAAVLDQIVYAMSAREHHGCYFNLSKSNTYFAIKLETYTNRPRPIIKMFNYFKYILTNSYKQALDEINTYPIYMHVFIEEQKEQIINDIRTQFKNIYISMFRQVRKIILCPEDNVDLNIYLYNDLNKHQHSILLSLIEQKNYDLLSDIIYNICVSQLEILTKLKNMDVSGEILMERITSDPDPYKWYKTINELI